MPPIEPDQFAPLNLDDGLYYANWEGWVSTMETQTVAAWNVVNLLARDFCGFAANVTWPDM